MVSERGMRISDADRDRSAAALSAHYAAGRLNLEEFRERLNQAYAAKTLGDLDDLTTVTSHAPVDLRRVGTGVRFVT